MNWKTILLIWCFAVVFSLGNFFIWRQRIAERDAAARKTLLLPLAASALTRVEISFAAGGRVSCYQEKGGRWRVSEPIMDLLDREVLEELKALISFGRGTEVSSPVSSGLFEKSTTLTVFAGKEKYIILVGRLNTDEQSYYVRKGVSEPKVYRVDRDLLRFLERPPELYRELSMFSEQLNQAQRIELRGTPVGKIVLELKPGGWFITQPVIWPAEELVVERLFERCKELKGNAIMAEKVGKFSSLGFTGSSPAITFSRSGSSATVFFAPPLTGNFSQGMAYRKDRAVVFYIPDQLRRYLVSTSFDTYRKHKLGLLSGIDIDRGEARVKQAILKLSNKKKNIVYLQALSKIILKQPQTKVEFVYKNFIWQGVSPQKFLPDVELLAGMVGRLRELQARTFVSAKQITRDQCGLEPAMLRVQLIDREGKVVVTLAIGKEATAKTRYASIVGQEDIFTIAGSFARSLFLPWFKFHLRPVSDFAPTAVKKLSIWRENKEFRYQRTTGDAWQQVLPETVPADALKLYIELLSQKGIGALRALDVVGVIKNNLSDFGLDQNHLRVVCEYTLPKFARNIARGEMARLDLYVGFDTTWRGKQVCFARLASGKVIFLLPARIKKILKDDYVDKTALAKP